MKFRFFFKYLVAMLLVAGSVASCYDGMTSDVSISSVRHGRKFVTSMTFAPMDNIPETKSQYTGSETVVNDWNLFVFDATGTRVGAYYKADGGDIEFSVLLGQEYTYFALANVGNMTASTSEAMHKTDIASFRAMTLDVTGYSGGLPMAWTGTRTFTREEYDNNNRSLSLDVRMKRLVGKFNIVYDPSLLNKWSYDVKTLNLYGVSTVKPFVEGSTGSSNATVNDSATAADIVALNGGQAVKFFPVENVVPTPSNLQSNNDPWRKVPGEVGLLYPSYIEITGEATMTDGSALKKNVTFRFYLGKDNVKNFEVVRNEENTITFQPTDDSIEEDPTVNWKVEPEPITDTRSIRFQRNITEVTSATNPFLLRSGLTSDEAVVRLVDNVASDFKYNVEVQGGTPADWLTVDNATGQPVSSLSSVTMSSLHLSAKAGTDAEGWVLISTLDGKKTDKLYVKVFNATIDVKPDDPITWDWNEHTQKDVTVTCTVPWTVTVPSGWSLTYATGGAVTGEQPACSNLALKILPPTADYMDIAEDGTSTLSFSAPGTEGDAVTLIRRYKPQVTSGGSSEAAMTWEWNQSGTGSGKTLTLSSNEDWVVVWPEGDHSHWNVSPASGAKTATSISVYPVADNEGEEPIVGTFYVVPVRDGHNVDEGRLTVTLTQGAGRQLVNLRFGLWPDATTERFHSDTTVTWKSSSPETIWPHVYADYSDGTVEMIAEADLNNGLVYDNALLGRPSTGYFYGKKACETTITASFTDKGITKNATANITVLHGDVYNFKILPESVSLLSGGTTQTFTPYKLYRGDDQWYELTDEEKQSIEWDSLYYSTDDDYAVYDIFTIDNGVITTIDKRGTRHLRAKWQGMYGLSLVEVYSQLVSLEYRPDVINMSTVGIVASPANTYDNNSFHNNVVPLSLIAKYHDGSEDDLCINEVRNAVGANLSQTEYVYHYYNPDDGDKLYLFVSRYVYGYYDHPEIASGLNVDAAKSGSYAYSPIIHDINDNEYHLDDGGSLSQMPAVFHESSFTYRGVTKTAQLKAVVNGPAYLNVSPSSLSWGATESHEQTVTISTNREWSFTVSGDDAAHFTVVRDGDVLKVTTTANDETSAREAVINITCASNPELNTTVTLTQEAKEAPVHTYTAAYLLVYTGDDEITVGGNTQAYAILYTGECTTTAETAPQERSAYTFDSGTSVTSSGFNTSNGSVASISNTNQVNGVAVGQVDITSKYSIDASSYDVVFTGYDSHRVTVSESAPVTYTYTAAYVDAAFGPYGSTIDVGDYTTVEATLYTGTCTTTATTAPQDKSVYTWDGGTSVTSSGFSSYNTGVATVTNTNRVNGIAAGTARIESNYEPSTSDYDVVFTDENYVTVTVVSGAVITHALIVSIEDPEIGVGGRTQATAKYVTYSDGVETSRVDVTNTSSCSWSSSDATVATVTNSNPRGRITGEGAGTANINASYRGESGSASITVTAAPVTTIYKVVTTADPDELHVGESTSLSATLYSSTDNGSSWTVVSSSPDGFVKVSGSTVINTSTGEATATGTGVYRGQFNGYSIDSDKCEDASITVTPAVVTTIYKVVTTANPAALRVGGSTSLSATLYSSTDDGSHWTVVSSSPNGFVKVSGTAVINTSTGEATATGTGDYRGQFNGYSIDTDKCEDATITVTPAPVTLDHIAFVHNNTEVTAARLDYSNSWLYDCEVWAFYSNGSHTDITSEVTIACPTGFYYANGQFSTDRETSGSATTSNWNGMTASISLTSVDALLLGGINPSFEDYTGTPSQPAQPGSWGVTTRLKITAYFLYALKEGGENRDITGIVDYSGDIGNIKLSVSQTSDWVSITPYQYATTGTTFSLTFSYQGDYDTVPSTLTVSFTRLGGGGTSISVEE